MGQKVFWREVKLKPLKGQKRRRIVTKESDWQDYYGSNKELLDDIRNVPDNMIRREIVQFCKSKAWMNYEEAKFQFEHDVLLDPEWYNNIIQCRINGNTL